MEGVIEKSGNPLSRVDVELRRPRSISRGAKTTPPTANKSRPTPKRFTGSRSQKGPATSISQLLRSQPLRIQPLIFYFSLTGTAEACAKQLSENIQEFFKAQSSAILQSQIHDLSNIDYDDFFVTTPEPDHDAGDLQYFYILLLPTYNIDTVLDSFLIHLQETHHDFRIDTAPLAKLAGYTVFGFGDREIWKSEEEGFCLQAIAVDKWMARLSSGKRAYPLGLADTKTDFGELLKEWTQGLCNVLVDVSAQKGLGEGVLGSGDALESDEEEVDNSNLALNIRDTTTFKPPKVKNNSRVDDVEDLGGRAQSTAFNSLDQDSNLASMPIDFTTYGSPSQASQAPKEMVPVSSPTHLALTKQGYSIIGSHSGVKICRWTKSALRGRGSCYKYSFYGIKSHLCMETTPSLSCSNKCVFCWRHGTNPVGTTWRWKVDPPDFIYSGAKEAHLKKIKMMKGVPGVRAERFQEAMRIRHCALSLVGEPIFYPHINQFISLLHADNISSFLVCNAQHPDHLEALQVVTQLYVSIDASNRESLKKVDRPLHRDFWERFLRCLDILRERRFRMRTVFRLTLVKGFNIEDEVDGYADLVERGLPCFVEVKGVTYCGTSSSAGAGLTMQNVPFYEEVTAFVEALNVALEMRGLDYGIAAEHAHSCCVLIASRRFFVDGEWHTLIDYERFFELLNSGKGFAPEDYMGPATPSWATWGQGGFDPADQRFYRKSKNITTGEELEDSTTVKTEMKPSRARRE